MTEKLRGTELERSCRTTAAGDSHLVQVELFDPEHRSRGLQAELASRLPENFLAPNILFVGMRNVFSLEVPVPTEGLVVGGRRYRLHGAVEAVDPAGGHFSATVRDWSSGSFYRYDDDMLRSGGDSLVQIAELQQRLGPAYSPPVRRLNAGERAIGNDAVVLAYIAEDAGI